MPNKYIIHGAAFNGDGTTSAEAASAGAPGAWNNIGVFTGTAVGFGALAAGDTVYIRSKTSAGADITVTTSVATTIGVDAATELGPITWVVDSGTVWPGVSGVVTYSMTGAGAWSLRNYNNLLASQYNLVIQNANATFLNTLINIGIARTNSVKFMAVTVDALTSVRFNGGIHEQPWFVMNGIITNNFASANNNSDTILISPKIELSGRAWSTGLCVFGMPDLKIFGGSLTSTGTVLTAAALSSRGMSAYGLTYPAALPLSNAAKFTTKEKLLVNGADGGLGNGVYDYWCEYSSRYDGFYPTLNATLESSGGTPWAYRLHPYRTTPQNPAQIAISKMWTQAPAAKTVTLEILYPTPATSTFALPTSDKVWVSIQYTDATTGLQVTQSTFDLSATELTASSAAWSSATYGATAFNKYKLALTTSSAIKQDTPVLVSFFMTPRATNAAPLDIVMVCPDPVFS